jgi:hypothetical protein
VRVRVVNCCLEGDGQFHLAMPQSYQKMPHAPSTLPTYVCVMRSNGQACAATQERSYSVGSLLQTPIIFHSGLRE